MVYIVLLFIQVNDTINEILRTFTNRIIEMDWLDSVTQSRSIEKVATLL